MAKKPKKAKSVESFRYDDATRKNIPTAEHQSVIAEEHKAPTTLRYPRNTDLDPQLVWRGKDEQDWSDLVVHAPPLYIQEKVHPKVLIDDLHLRSKEAAEPVPGEQIGLFADFNGLEEGVERTEFYQHDQNWSNRLILGDSLQVMASLAEREGLRGQVQCIYIDPPYGIRFNSNFQWSTTTRDVRDGKPEHITREPEQVKAFRDTWRDGIHSYLTYLRDRLTVARDLLSVSGSVFVQIGDENVFRVRALLSEVFGERNFISLITFKKSSSATERFLSSTADYILWYAKDCDALKYRPIKATRELGGLGGGAYRLLEEVPDHWRSLSDRELSEITDPASHRILRLQTLTSQRQGRDTGPSGAMSFPVDLFGTTYRPSRGRGWTTTKDGISRLYRAGRIGRSGSSINYKRYFGDAPAFPIYNIWDDTQSGSGMEKTYVVQTNTKVVERCLLMATDPGDLVLDPTCGSGTTASVAEQWGRRWITIDTSRVALALARARIMGARYTYYLLADSHEGKTALAVMTRTAPPASASHGRLRHGFVYERVPRITLGSIANNSEIDIIWEQFQTMMEAARRELNEKAGLALEEWEIPLEPGRPWPEEAEAQHSRFNRVTTATTKQKAVDRINRILDRTYSIETLPPHPIDPWADEELIDLHRRWWELRIERQKEVDASIAAKADFEYLYDKPYEDPNIVRVAGPFTVESLSPHRVLGVDEDDELIDPLDVNEPAGEYGDLPRFDQIVLENLRTAGVQQAHKEDRIEFTSLTGWPGDYICAEGRYQEAETTKRAGIFLGPEFGTVSRPDLVEAAREAGDAGFDVLIACAFNYEAHASEFHKLGRIPVLKARMNADLHMAEDLKNTGKGNLFVIFGEPDIDILETEDDQLQVQVNGVDVFDPTTGEIRSDDVDGIACWFVDTDYNGESFFVRHAYFLGANDPYKSLKTTLKAEINEEAWATLHSAVSRPFDRPETGRIAVKVINHLGDEVMKVFRVS